MLLLLLFVLQICDPLMCFQTTFNVGSRELVVFCTGKGVKQERLS